MRDLLGNEGPTGERFPDTDRGGQKSAAAAGVKPQPSAGGSMIPSFGDRGGKIPTALAAGALAKKGQANLIFEIELLTNRSDFTAAPVRLLFPTINAACLCPLYRSSGAPRHGGSEQEMKEGIHPEYQETTVTCGCGNTFQTRSTRPELKLDICSECHPFYTGKLKYVDTAGRIDKFQKKFAAGTYGSLKKKKPGKNRK